MDTRAKNNNSIVVSRYNDGQPLLLNPFNSYRMMVDELELLLTKRLVVHGEFEEVDIKPRPDIHWLKCTTMSTGYNIQTILGIIEDNEAETTTTTTPSTVDITTFHVTINLDSPTTTPIHLCGPHSDWVRHDIIPSSLNNDKDVDTTTTKRTSLWWIDFRNVQQQQEETILSTQQEIVQFVRSIFTISHETSPWSSNEKNDTLRPDMMVLAFQKSDNDDDNHNPARLLEEFRTSDVAPSWFLHARVQLDELEETQQHGTLFCNKKTFPSSSSHQPATLLIYKKIGPRPSLSTGLPKSVNAINQVSREMKGCLVETYLFEQDNNEQDHPDHGDKKEQEVQQNSSTQSSQLCRWVCPPYLNLQAEYPNTRIAELFSPESIEVFTKDALSIPQWTPWPESIHYGKGRSEGPIPWTVFPLCYCFPASQPENLTWIATTRSFVPQTCSLLQELVGPLHLRTALFSQLQPHSVLEAHTGWADLANHVLRLHIPLIVPEEDMDLCGTWVDGCVESHRVGRPLLFDDSKIHRAFNYSDKTRIVLIVDLARPSHLPPGYATGGHSDELDAFIAQMSTPN
jgi:hypothetical protein